jgi:hypothetical protein
MYTESTVVTSRTEDFKVEVLKRLPHDYTKPYYVVKINGIERIKHSSAEDVVISLVGVIESMYERMRTPKAF